MTVINQKVSLHSCCLDGGWGRARSKKMSRSLWAKWAGRRRRFPRCFGSWISELPQMFLCVHSVVFVPHRFLLQLAWPCCQPWCGCRLFVGAVSLAPYPWVAQSSKGRVARSLARAVHARRSRLVPAWSVHLRTPHLASHQVLEKITSLYNADDQEEESPAEEPWYSKFYKEMIYESEWFVHTLITTYKDPRVKPLNIAELRYVIGTLDGRNRRRDEWLVSTQRTLKSNREIYKRLLYHT